MRGIPSFRTAASRPDRPAARVAAQIALTALSGLALIAATRAVLAADAVGMAVAMLAFLLACGLVADRMRHGYPHDRIGGCNVVTLLRAALVCALLMPLAAGRPAGWAVAGVAGLALVLDGLDGALARRSGLASRLGARFDIEVDAALALILALHIIAGTAVGAEILVLGLTRYAFEAAGLAWPWLRADLPDRRWRKAICVVQIATLILLQTPLPDRDQAIPLARLAALLLVASFAVDIRWLWRHRP
ncbi:CDP-alcohol phosphatidyltransferase family protein [uncultured Paracoccus sp.]|uniref:CDP-alcohol phosphatidyltransferase family protein n=1 Tax=uncultured Paracoccus sp. TaxID=189685 RepID=UPI0025E88B74|nr:CDP-alcohol phosphatidyltransferase family protein [uncultured Paracoccus sp.]